MRLLRAFVVVLAVSLVGVAATVAISALGRPSFGAAGAAPSVPDTLLLVRQATAAPFLPTRNEVLLLEPQSGAFRPVLEGAQEPVVAPDGRALFFVQHLEVGDQVRTAVVALASETLAPLWSADVAARSTTEATEKPYALWVRLTATDDRVYVASHVWQSPDSLTVVALDRATGHERARWSVDLGEAGANSFGLFAAPDGSRLHLLVPSPKTSPTELLYFRFRLPAGQEEARAAPVKGSTASSFAWSGRPTADGRALFYVASSDSGRRLAVEFLDLVTGAVQGVDLPFQSKDSIPNEAGLSHDGRRLYVLAPTLGELAVVDLAERRLEQTLLVDTGAGAAADAPLLARAWASVQGLFVREALAKVYFQGAVQASPDDRRLYAVGAAGRGDEARPDGVWVIETGTWRVTDRWLPGFAPATLLLSADGRYLYAQQAPWGQGADVGVVRVLDTMTGAPVFASESLPAARLVSLAELYRTAYGKSPAAVPAGVGLPIQPIASMEVAVGPNTVVGGDAVAVELRFADPASGRTVEARQAGVRYEPPARVTATLLQRHARGEDRTVALDPAGYGVYHGTVVLPSPASWSDGSWSARVIAEWPDGLRRRAALEDAVVVQPSFAGTDGRRYILQVTTDPTRPVVDQLAAVRAAFVDADTRAPLPAGVTLADAMPDAVEAAFFGDGVTTEDLRPAGHGVYEGNVRVWSSGAWRVWASLHRAGVPSVSLAVGSLRAVQK
jgi:hypothetical protein